MAIDIELQRIKQENVVDVYNTVYKLRHCRMSTVQTLVIHNMMFMIQHVIAICPQAQYMFVFDALLESIKCGDHCIIGPASVAKERLDKLSKVDPTTKMSGYESQFKVTKSIQIFTSVVLTYVLNVELFVQKLEVTSPKVTDFQYDSAYMDQNSHKNRSMKCLPRKLLSELLLHNNNDSFYTASSFYS